jgi:hypothetical protein
VDLETDSMGHHPQRPEVRGPVLVGLAKVEWAGVGGMIYNCDGSFKIHVVPSALAVRIKHWSLNHELR